MHLTGDIHAITAANNLLGTIYPTVRTGIIENGARTSRISPFRLGGENAAREVLQPSAEIADLTRRGNSNVPAIFSIISVFTISFNGERFLTFP